MARMIPSEPVAETTSTAERRLFERLRDDTSSELVAFHSVAWLVPGAGKPQQGEADFVLAHPGYGLVTLEVKGGSISYDGAKAQWQSTGKQGKHSIKDPVRQAERSSFLLRESLRRARRQGDERIGFGHAVAFPDTKVGSRPLRPNLPREIVVDHGDLSDLGARVERLLHYWHDPKRDEPLGAEGITLLERVLAKSFDLRSPLAHELEEEERELLQLTEEQYEVLDLLSRQTRVAIAGCAGSGKTFLAAEKARRLAEQGFHVLIVCFNVLLARHLRRGLAGVEAVDAFSFDELCHRIVTEAGTSFPESPTPGEEGAYYTALHEEFAEAVDVAARRYGAVIVDEAQDIHPDWWVPLQLLLEDPDESPLYVFFDDNQRLFAVPVGLPVPGEPVQLSINCRNTQRINAVVTPYYRGGTVRARGPEGPPVDIHFYASDDELLAALDTSVRSWMTEAEISPDDIALLTAKSAERSALWRVDSLGGARLTDDPWDAGKILRASVYRYKGLERLVVAVTELDGAREAAFYVGFSRPKVFLSIFCPEGSRRKLPAELLHAA